MSRLRHADERREGGGLPRPRRARPAADNMRLPVLALAGLLLVGIALRLLLMVAKTPAFVGYGDGGAYVGAAHGDLFGPPRWPVGYPLFLRATHALVPNLSLTILVQHAFGVATALLLFAIVRRVVPAGWGLIPAAVVLLAGPQLFLEHAPLSETLFGLLAVGACYCAVRALDVEHAAWACAAGLLAAAAASVRSVGVLLPFLIAAWLVASAPGGLRRRLMRGGAAALCAWLVIAVYVIAAKHEAGYVGPGLVRNGGVNLYAGVAGFADCGRFTPPAGTRGLCEQRPPSRRPGPLYYDLDPRAPVAQTFRSQVRVRPHEDAALSAFARAAILHQPLDYLRDVGTDLTRFWSSSAHSTRFDGEDYDTIAEALVSPAPPLIRLIDRWYSTGESVAHEGPLDFMRGYERHTRLEGPAFMLLVLLALAGLPLARGRRLAVGLLMLSLSLATLVAPIALAFFDARFMVPGYGPLAAAGAIGAASLWERVAARRVAPAGPARERVAA